ncbi:PREDICTED: inactive N-acetylated-alpha-linked acidic dipeptidase-like protein 2, partial [Chlamydotis macqueenii]|uniref:inactive N-acetylated-alpha-linked acidic dipeptidase-like protein 2 n=1 Tax=Chlamydotis macqueenii TaxID=187382 RepID=UPI000529B1C2
MAYHKVNADQRAQGHSPYLDNDELQGTALELEWDMEKELEEPGFDHFRLDGEKHHLENTQSPDLDLEPIQPSSSPKGRFQRLQEDPDYISHYTRQAPKSNRCNFFQILKVFCTALILFIFGVVIGYYARKKCPSPSTSQEPNNPHIYHEILKEIKAENIQQIYRDLLQFPREDDVDIAMKILVQWSSQGLEDVRLVNYSVLLDLPGSSSNTVTLKNSGECFYPSGQQCNRGTKTLHSQDFLYSYAAYSAKGTLEAELVDVQYGTVEDLIRVQAITNVTKKIALLKLGQSPLLYKLYVVLGWLRCKGAVRGGGATDRNQQAGFRVWSNLELEYTENWEYAENPEVNSLLEYAVESLIPVWRSAKEVMALCMCEPQGSHEQYQCKRSTVKPDTVVCNQDDAKSLSAPSGFTVEVSPDWELAAGFES